MNTLPVGERAHLEGEEVRRVAGDGGDCERLEELRSESRQTWTTFAVISVSSRRTSGHDAVGAGTRATAYVRIFAPGKAESRDQPTRTSLPLHRTRPPPGGARDGRVAELHGGDDVPIREPGEGVDLPPFGMLSSRPTRRGMWAR